MKADTLKDLFIYKMNELYTAEKKTLQFLPRLAEACSSQELKDALQQHIKQSQDQVARLEKGFSVLKLSPQEVKDPVVDGLISKGEEILKSISDPDLKDAALIAAEQGIEHYEITGYGTARSYARNLGMKDIESLLQETLDEESYTDEKLSKIADKGYSGPAINKKAA